MRPDRLSFDREDGLTVPVVMSLWDEVQGNLFEWPCADAELILLNWFRASRARWCAAQRAKERREVFHVVDGDAG